MVRARHIDAYELSTIMSINRLERSASCEKTACVASKYTNVSSVLRDVRSLIDFRARGLHHLRPACDFAPQELSEGLRRVRFGRIEPERGQRLQHIGMRQCRRDI